MSFRPDSSIAAGICYSSLPESIQAGSTWRICFACSFHERHLHPQRFRVGFQNHSPPASPMECLSAMQVQRTASLNPSFSNVGNHFCHISTLWRLLGLEGIPWRSSFLSGVYSYLALYLNIYDRGDEYSSSRVKTSKEIAPWSLPSQQCLSHPVSYSGYTKI